MARFWNSLRSRLIVLVLLGTLPTLALVCYDYRAHVRLGTTLVQQKAFLTAGQASTAVSLVVDSTRHLLSCLAQDPAMKSLDVDSCNRMVAHCYGNRPFLYYANIGMIDARGKLICSATPLTGDVDLSDRYYFQQAIKTRDFSVGHYQVDRVTGRTTVNFGYPLIGPTGEIQAVLFAALELTWLTKIVEAADLPPGSLLTIVDSDGTVLGRSRDAERWVGKKAQDAEIVRACLESHEGVIEAVGMDGVRKHYGFRTLTAVPDAGYVYVGIPSEVITSHSRKLLTVHLMAVAVALMLGVAAALTFGHLFVMRNVWLVMQAARRLSGGDFTARSGLTEANGEIGNLGQAFDQMAETLAVREHERDEAQAKVAGEQQLTETILESLPAVFYVFDEQGRMKRWNSRFEKVSGYSAEEVAQMHALDFVAEEERVITESVIREVFACGESSVEASFFTKAGSRIPHYFTGTRMTVEGTDWLLGMAVDISERRKAEEAVKTSEQMLKDILATSPVGIVVAEDRVFKWANEAWEKMFGFERTDEYVGKTSRILYPSDDEYERVGKALYGNLQPGTVTEIDATIQRRDGSLSYAQVRANLRKGFDPERRAVIVAFSDISERRKAEEALRQNEERYRSLFELSSDAILLVHPEGEIIDANRACSQLLGAPLEDVIGADVMEFYANPIDRQEFRRRIHRDGSVKQFEWRVRRRDGSERQCVLHSTLWTDKDGNVVAYVSSARDVTEARILEKQLFQAQKMEAIGTLAAGVAHDFNNILQVALGYSELILGDEGLPQRYRADIQKINESARRGADLVQRLLTFSRKTEVKLLPLNLNRCVNELRKMLERTVPKMIEIQLVLAEDLAAINADGTQIDQILMNLAVNARDAMPQGGRLVFETANVILDEEYAASHFAADPGNYVLLIVTDTGIGMDKEALEHIFEPFYTTKGVGEGTGLGLATVYGIVHQHGGHIRCYSEPGEGTTFKIYFPALVSDKKLEETVARALPRGGSETILLVDDEELIRDLGTRILTKAGYKVITASDGKEALKVYEQRGGEISLVILDLIMPKMGGRQSLECLLSLNPSVKVVISSGYSSDTIANEVRTSRAKGFVNKPYDIRQVLEVVRGVLDAE
jgi:PAS domain S-box-containing protein